MAGSPQAEARDEVRCLVCGGATSPWLTVPADWRRPTQTPPYPLRYCHACEFGQVEPRPTPEQVTAAYALDYYTHDLDASTGGKQHANVLAKLVFHLAWRRDSKPEVTADEIEQLGGGKPFSICDVGCGAAVLLEQLQQRGHETLGIEPDAAARQVAEQRGVRVLPGTAESLPDEVHGKQFDVVQMRHVLEHCAQPQDAMRLVTGLVRPDGKLAIEVPNNACVGLRSAGQTWPWLDVPRHLNFFTPTSLSRLCAQHGLVVEQVIYRGYCRQFSPAWIENEAEIWRAFVAVGRGDTGRRRTAWRNLQLLLRTAWASDAAKYDSVCVVCRPRGAEET